MLCPKCINTVEDNANVCPNCGNQLKSTTTNQSVTTVVGGVDMSLTNSEAKPQEPVNTNVGGVEMSLTGSSLPEQNNVSTMMGGVDMSLTSGVPEVKEKKDYITPIKEFITKNKKLVLIVTGVLLVIVVGLILFFTLWDFTKLEWDTKYGHYKTTHTGPTTVELRALAYDREEQRIYDLKYEVSGGEVKTTGSKAEWKLPEKEGKYTITAIAPSGKKITKTIEVVLVSDEKVTISEDKMFYEEKDEDDLDGDTLTTAKEKELGTNPHKQDSDGDGLRDDYEINISKTDPTKRDSDGDTIADGYELEVGLNPLTQYSLNDNVKDSERELKYTVEYNDIGVKVEISGKGEIANTTVDSMKNSTFEDMSGVLDEVYNFYTTGKLDSAIVTIKYNEQDLLNEGLSEDTLTLYYFNEETKELEAIPTIVDKENNTITVTLNHFSKYIIGDSTKVKTTLEAEILFVLDNSISMYTEDQVMDTGKYSSVTGAVGNDKEYKRVTLTNKMIDTFTGNYSFGVAEFAGSYKELKSFSANKDEVKASVESIKANWSVSTSGTHIITALKSGIAEFENNGKSHYIMLLTDGENTNDSWYSNKSTIISSAKEKNVKVCVIGLGEVDEDDLNEIAEATGCDFYNANDTKALDSIYQTVGADINYNYVDTDGDNKTDGVIVANSGFIAARDGFSFKNFRSNKSAGGHCYGMATFASLYYQNKLPMSLGEADKGTLFKNYDPSKGYNLNYTYFSKGKKLYDFKTTDPGLTMLLYGLPADYRDRVEDSVWKIKEEHKETLEKIGVTFSIKKYTGDQPNIKKYESAQLNIEDTTFEANVSKDEAQMLNAIWRLFIEQNDDKRTSFSSEPDKAYKELVQYFEDGVPVVLGVANCHAINGIKLIQDVDNANKFKIEVYDNNYPGEVRYIYAERTKFSKFQLNFTAWTNEYEYTFRYDMGNDGTAEEIDVILAHTEI